LKQLIAKLKQVLLIPYYKNETGLRRKRKR
jgi:hypothetical protein